MTAEKYEQAKIAEPSLRDVHEAVISIADVVRNMSSQIEDIAGTTRDIHDMVSYQHNSPGYDSGCNYDGLNDSEEC